MTSANWYWVGIAAMLLPIALATALGLHHYLTCRVCRWHRKSTQDDSQEGK